MTYMNSAKPKYITPATSDLMFQRLLTEPTCRPFLAKTIHFVTNIDYELLIEKMKVTDMDTLIKFKNGEYQNGEYNDRYIMVVVDENKCIWVGLYDEKQEFCTNLITFNS